MSDAAQAARPPPTPSSACSRRAAGPRPPRAPRPGARASPRPLPQPLRARAAGARGWGGRAAGLSAGPRSCVRPSAPAGPGECGAGGRGAASCADPLPGARTGPAATASGGRPGVGGAAVGSASPPSGRLRRGPGGGRQVGPCRGCEVRAPRDSCGRVSGGCGNSARGSGRRARSGRFLLRTRGFHLRTRAAGPERPHGDRDGHPGAAARALPCRRSCLLLTVILVLHDLKKKKKVTWEGATCLNCR